MRRRIVLPFVVGMLGIGLLACAPLLIERAREAYRSRRLARQPRTLAAASRRDGATLGAEIREVAFARRELRINPFFVGEIVNTGTEALELPRAWVTLADGDAGVRGLCQPMIWSLEPGEKVGCAADVSISPFDWTDGRVELEPLVRAKEHRPKLTVLDAAMGHAETELNPWIRGHVRNDSGRRLATVWAIVSIYGADGRIVGAENVVVNEKAGGDLAAGAIGELAVELRTLASEPVTFTVLPTAEPEP